MSNLALGHVRIIKFYIKNILVDDSGQIIKNSTKDLTE